MATVKHRVCTHCRQTMRKEIPGVFRCGKCGTVWMNDRGYFKHEPGTEYRLEEVSVQGTTVFVPCVRKIGEPETEGRMDLARIQSEDEEPRPSAPNCRTAEQIVYGGIYYIKKRSTEGHEQHLGRPGIVVSSVCEGDYNQVVTVVLLTTAEKVPTRTRVRVTSSGAVSTALIEQVTTVDTSRIGDFMGMATPQEMMAIKKSLAAHFGMMKFVDENANSEQRDNYIQQLESQASAMRSQLNELQSIIDFQNRRLGSRGPSRREI